MERLTVVTSKEDLTHFVQKSILKVVSDSEDSEDEEIKKAPAKQVKFWTGK